MTGAGLPPIALEAVLKLLAIGQERSQARKTAKAAVKPKLDLALAAPKAAPFAPAARGRVSGSRMPQQRGTNARSLSSALAHSEGAERC